MSDTTVPRLSSLIDSLVRDDSSTVREWYVDDQAVLVLDSTAIVLPAPAGSTDRRAFLTRASILSLAIPGVGPALAACAPAGSADYTTASLEPVRSTMRAFDSASQDDADRAPLRLESGDVSLTNDVDMTHWTDFLPARINPRRAFRSVTKEFVIVQSASYLADAASGVRTSDGARTTELPRDVMARNGRPNQHLDVPIRVKVGDRVRLWVKSAVGMVFELVCDVPGEFPFVNHGFGHGQKGAIGILVVEP